MHLVALTQLIPPSFLNSFLESSLSSSSQTAITEYYSLGLLLPRLNTRHSFLSILEARSPRSECQHGWFLVRVLLLTFRELPSCRVLSWRREREEEGSHSQDSSNPRQSPISECHHTGVRASTYGFGGGGGSIHGTSSFGSSLLSLQTLPPPALTTTTTATTNLSMSKIAIPPLVP